MDIFENICRTCGNDCLDALDIFDDSVMVLDKNILISEILSSCLPSSASLPALSEDDDYPKQICRVCIKKLIMIYEFNNKWITATNEFTVALKFEQRRNRSRLTQSISSPDDQLPLKCIGKAIETNLESIAPAHATGIKAETIVFKHEPSEGTEIGDLIEEAELVQDMTPRTSISIRSATNYQCALCNECYHTLAAYQKHHKVNHRNSQFMFFTPRQ
ncbi:PREDICTED: uncharacterized protein LOC108619792 [Drosophila arizonae]|uniref:Uncharacterized protein LOC108619792 n=1 Tax=Drosophila arizonae TaxID=7263 RepID=A0ABM1PXW2_DROAR|nr:PREDICTED: uncharacterized protein LOC108619792 [Drosophila arizonae]